MRLIQYFPQQTTIDFMRWRKAMAIISLVLLAIVGALLVKPGLNYGIDFRGGMLLEVRTPEAADLGAIRSAVDSLGYGETSVQTFGSSRDVLVRLQLPQELAQQEVQPAVLAILPQGSELRRSEFVGPAVGKDLITRGVMAVAFSLIAIFVYLWLRFEWQFGFGAIIATVHDVVLTVGLYLVLQMEFSLAVVAAILTVAGYSVNDTVVVYDRVRDNLRKYRQKPLLDVLNLSLNETLSRTLLTSVTTLVALIVLYLFGGESLQGFCLALICGILVGTYSSLFVASPMLLLFPPPRGESAASAPEARSVS